MPNKSSAIDIVSKALSELLQNAITEVRRTAAEANPKRTQIVRAETLMAENDSHAGNRSLGRVIAERIMQRLGLDNNDFRQRDPLVLIACKELEGVELQIATLKQAIRDQQEQTKVQADEKVRAIGEYGRTLEDLEQLRKDHDSLQATLNTELECRQAAERAIATIPAMCNGDFSQPCPLHVREPIERLFRKRQIPAVDPPKFSRCELCFGYFQQKDLKCFRVESTLKRLAAVSDDWFQKPGTRHVCLECAGVLAKSCD